MTQVDGDVMRPGDSWQLPDGLGSITFDGLEQYATFSIAHDPGQLPALLGALAALGGLMLSLFVRRRRGWVRGTGADGGRSARARARPGRGSARPRRRRGTRGAGSRRRAPRSSVAPTSTGASACR